MNYQIIGTPKTKLPNSKININYVLNEKTNKYEISIDSNIDIDQQKEILKIIQETVWEKEDNTPKKK